MLILTGACPHPHTHPECNLASYILEAVISPLIIENSDIHNKNTEGICLKAPGMLLRSVLWLYSFFFFDLFSHSSLYLICLLVVER